MHRPNPLLIAATVLLLSTLTIQIRAQYVFAHYMMGNTYDSDIGTFVSDIERALVVGIDAFALNLGPDDWMSDRVGTMFQAASHYPKFKLFFSFDMTVMSDVNSLLGYVQQYAHHNSSFWYSEKYFVSTFAGQGNNFGEDNVNDGWQIKFKDPLDAQGIPVFFVPSFFVPPQNIFETYPVMDGYFDWTAWSLTDSLKNTDNDEVLLSDATKNNKTYMAGVSPWFFTHFGAPYNKNWIYKSEALWPTRWQQILDLKPQFVEIITWNDYGESHYVGPIAGSLPAGSEAWVTGFDHAAWMDLASYYIQAYKTGSLPEITADKVYYWYRTHSKNVTRSDPVGRPKNADWADDDIVVFALLTSDAEISVNTGGNTFNFNVHAGSNLFQQPFGQGNVTVSLIRNNQTLASQQGNNTIQDSGSSSYNFNANVGYFEYHGSSDVRMFLA